MSDILKSKASVLKENNNKYIEQLKEELKENLANIRDQNRQEVCIPLCILVILQYSIPFLLIFLDMHVIQFFSCK